MKIPIKITKTKEEKLEEKLVDKEAKLPESSQENILWYERISKISLYILVFLLPLFFLPWTSNVLDFNKHALLGVLVLISLLAWLIKVLVSNKLEIIWDRTLLAILAFIAFYGLSTIFSLWPEGSLWGWPLTVNAGFLTVLSLVIFYFLAVNIFRKKEEALGILLLLAISGFLAALLGIFQLFGKFVFPFNFARQTSFNTIGTVNSLGVFLAAIFPIVLILGFAFKKFLKALMVIFGVGIFSVLVLINFWVSWLVLIVGLSVLYIFGILNIKVTRQTSLVSLPISLLVVAIFFLFFNFSLPGFPQTPIEVSPSYRAELGIIKSAFSQKKISDIVFGTGPGTFVYSYSKFKPQTINQTIFWNTRFGSGASDILDRLLTTGLLGLAAFLSIFFLFWKKGFNYLRETVGRQENKLSWTLTLGVFSSFSAILTALVLYPANLSLIFLFWTALAVLSILGSNAVKSWQLEPSSYAMVVMSTVLVLVIISGVGLSFIGVQKYFGEVEYLRGIRLFAQGKTEEAISKLLSATNFNPKQDNYWRDLSQLYLVRANQLVNEKQDATVVVSNAVTAAGQATQVNPNNVANWSVRGFVYRQLIGLVGGADKWAEDSYKKAIELEPANPYLHTELGIVYALKKDFDSAKDSFNKALELKPDYTPAINYLQQIEQGSQPQPPIQEETPPEILETE